MLVMVGALTEAHRPTYLQKLGGNRIRFKLLVRTVENNHRYFRFRRSLERRKIGRFSWRGG